MSPRRLLVPIALLGAVTLTACAQEDAAEFDTSAAAEPAGASAAEDASSSQSEAPEAATTETVAGEDANDVLESYQVEVDGMPAGSTVTVGVREVRVEGEVLLLQLYFTPDTPGDDSTEWGLDTMYGESPVRPILTDRINLKQYNLLQDTPYNPWSSEPAWIDVTSGETALWWGYYAAPGEGVETLQLQVGPEHPVIDVPVQR